MRSHVIVAALCVAAASLLVPASAAAQTGLVRGTVTARESGDPIAGAAVVLLDESGARRGFSLTDPAGRYAIRAAPGRYRLQVQRIGVRDVEGEPFVLEADASVVRDIAATAASITLEGITVEARRRCVVRPTDGLAIATLWAEAGKALRSAAHADRAGYFRFRVRHHTRTLDPRSLRVLSDSAQEASGSSDRSPFVGRPIRQLLDAGFVVARDETLGYEYFAPDAEALLSDEFLDAHCFRLTEDLRRAPELIGISFEPVGGLDVPSVEGTFWLDRNSYELRFLEYRYTRGRLPAETVSGAGGRIEFEALPTGAWIVRRWHIRMPVLRQVAHHWMPGTATPPVQVAALAESGGEILEVRSRSGEVVQSATLASLTGAVRDSAAGTPLAGARVALTGTSRTATTDAQGGFRFDGLAAGDFAIAVTHPDLLRFGAVIAPTPVSLVAGRSSRVEVVVPPRARLEGLAWHCPARVEFHETGILAGTVSDRVTGRSLGGANVHVTWQDASAAESIPVTAGADGYYVACGIPLDRPIRVEAEYGARRSEPRVVEPVGAIAVGEQDIQILLNPPIRIVLRVLDDATGRPVSQANVTLVGAGTARLTDRAGRVTFENLPPGSHYVTVSHIAYGERREAFVADDDAELELRLVEGVIELEAIRVVSRASVTEARRRSGARLDVVTREDLDRVDPSSSVTDLVRRFPGVMARDIFHSNSSLLAGICIESRRGPTRLQPEGCASVLVLLDGVPVHDTGVLHALSPAHIESIEYVPTALAGARYGTGAMHGAILIHTRGNGPYRSR